MHVTDEEKAPLFQLMYQHAFVAPAAIAYGTAGPATITLEEAEEALERHNSNFDYFQGHGIKTNFAGNEISFRNYDRDTRDYTAAELLEQLRR